jgi:hypothetical protein
LLLKAWLALNSSILTSPFSFLFLLRGASHPQGLADRNLLTGNLGGPEYGDAVEGARRNQATALGVNLELPLGPKKVQLTLSPNPAQLLCGQCAVQHWARP